MPSYCCFLHPKAENSEKSLTDCCPECGNEYGFPLVSPPSKVGNVTITGAIDRGFYGAAFSGTKPPFNKRPVVVKLVPKGLYQFFGKDFEQECLLHDELADNTNHVIQILDMGEERVQFGDIQIDCHYAVLDYAKGPTLQTLISRDRSIPAHSIAQITIDLYQILQELSNKGIHHNDLHSGNLIVQKLAANAVRGNAIDESIIVKAIDLGSASGDSLSTPDGSRVGDLRRVVSHVRALSDKLLSDPEGTTDVDFRLAALIYEHCSLLDGSPTKIRVPNFEELIRQIYDVIIQPVDYPWRRPLSLKRFNDSYNAQTLYSWHVPFLVVDPDEQWLRSITIQGPTIITGMRGCGKTILLRSADFHARANRFPFEDKESIVEGVSADGFVGLYCSSTRLLRNDNRKFETLFIGYLRAGIKALLHLYDISPKLVAPDASTRLGELADSILCKGKGRIPLGPLHALDRTLLKLLHDVETDDTVAALSEHPAAAFESLASEIKRCSSLWSNQTVFFLLDDVSTRYLTEDQVKDLVSELLFSSTTCAFKFTTEAQTLELVIHAPGQNSPAWAGRDYSVFDLGYEVSQKLKLKGKGQRNSFISAILKQRAEHYSLKPVFDPINVLGDQPMQRIAETIASTSENSSARKSSYHGLSALAGVCVGDIGDAISLYDEIIRQCNGVTPVPKKIQSECFQSYCSRKIYDLSRRQSDLKDYALEFAEASRKLLIQSHKSISGRLRQYTQVYVRITSGVQQEQLAKLRMLIDSGVFVLEGGTGAPRTKTRDADPVTQFKLKYRKLFGLSSFIPLGDRDRFELSGPQLEDWLGKPDQGCEILMRNLHSDATSEALTAEDEDDDPEIPLELVKQETFDLKMDEAIPHAPENIDAGPLLESLDRRLPSFQNVTVSSLRGTSVDVCIFGLGFEERCLKTAQAWLNELKPKHAICIGYPEHGHTDQLLELLQSKHIPYDIIDHIDAPQRIGDFIKGKVGLVDVSGLSTPNIFSSVRAAIANLERVIVAHGVATDYYPLNEDIESILQADQDADVVALLDALGHIWSGESKPYEIESLLPSSVDESKERALCAFAAAKHERLLTLLDKREFDVLYLAAPSSESPRDKLAKMAAEVASRDKDRTSIGAVDTTDCDSIARWLLESYKVLFMAEGCNVEVGLAGSKSQTVVTAALSTVLKFSACWYVRPKKFAPDRFTSGLSKVKLMEIVFQK